MRVLRIQTRAIARLSSLRAVCQARRPKVRKGFRWWQTMARTGPEGARVTITIPRPGHLSSMGGAVGRPRRTPEQPEKSDGLRLSAQRSWETAPTPWPNLSASHRRFAECERLVTQGLGAVITAARGMHTELPTHTAWPGVAGTANRLGPQWREGGLLDQLTQPLVSFGRCPPRVANVGPTCVQQITRLRYSLRSEANRSACTLQLDTRNAATAACRSRTPSRASQRPALLTSEGRRDRST